MSSHPIRRKDTRVALVILLAFISIAALATLATADHPEDQDANNGGTGLSEWVGDWVVGSGDDLVYRNQTISLDGTLEVKAGGKLVLQNVTLVLHGAELDPQEIGVHGEMVISDLDGDPDSVTDMSVIKADDPDYNYYFQAYEGSTINVTNSKIMNCGRLFNVYGYRAGLYIGTEDAVISGLEILDGYGGIFIDGVDITVSDCNIHDNIWIGIYVDNGAAPLIEGCHIEDNLREGMMIKAQSDVVLRDSWIRGNLRGILVDRAYLSAHDTAISSNEQVDLDLPYFSSVEMFNCTVSTSASITPIRLENSSLTSTHGNFDIDSVDLAASLFWYQQFLTVTVTYTDSRSTPIADVPVQVEDAESRVFNYITDANGMLAYQPMLVMEYDKTTTILKTILYNPFHVTVSHNLQEQDAYVDMRYGNGQFSFQYVDTVDPTAVAPSLTEANVGVNTTLDGSASHDDVAIESWNWSFEELGEPVYLDGEMVEYAFKEAKRYSITLKVTDTSGNSGMRSIVTFDVTARDRTAPVADAGDPQIVDQGTVVTFDGSNSTDNVGIVSYIWSFTYDGAPRSLTGMIVTWKFDIPGYYPVALTVEDAAGLTGSNETSVTVLDKLPPVTEVTFNPLMPENRKYNEVVQIIFQTDDESGGQIELNYRVNDDPWLKVVGALSLSFGDALQYPDGTYEIEYYAVDAVGNQEELQTIAAFLVDATPPTFTDMDPPITPFPTTKETYTISGRTEPGATLVINEDNVTVEADGSFSYETDLEIGDNPYYLHAVDVVGHTADITIIIVREKYDNGPDDTDGGNLAYFIGGAVVAVVLVLLVLYFFVLRKREEETPPM